MEQKLGKWFEENQAKLKECSPKEHEQARRELIRYVKRCLKGHTDYGAHSEETLHEDAVDHYVQTAWQKLCEGEWEWKERRTLSQQLCRIASCLIEKQVKKYCRASARGETGLEVSVEDVELMGLDIIDSVDDKAERRELGYELMRRALKGKPELLAYVDAVSKGGTYDDIAERLGLDSHAVVLLERRVIYRLTEYRLRRL